MKRDDNIYHLCIRSHWEQALLAGEYLMSTREKTLEDVGYIHCSTSLQLPLTAKKFYGGCTEELVLLEISVIELEKDGISVLYEDAGNGEFYPHIYGALPCAVVSRTYRAGFDSAGELTFV